jgi:hypothetical protein
MKTVNVVELLNIEKTLDRLKLTNPYESRFLSSLTNDKNIKNKLFDSYSYSYKGYRIETYLSDRQFSIYNKLVSRFKTINIYERYTDYFDIKKIKLDDYDSGYFETYVDEFVETENFKKWLNEIQNK